MDCSVVPLKRFPDQFMVSTTDFFYPLVEDPYIQGRIACANVLSDLYAMGVMNCDTMLMLLGVSTDMNQLERDVCTKLIIKGFNDVASESETLVTGGQTVMNPWPTVGGVASCICRQEDFIMPENALVGDVLVLTKPLGTQVAVNLHQWLFNETSWNRIADIVTRDQAEEVYQQAMFSMARTNRFAAQLMHKYGAHAATDVTGFGLLGHAKNLAKNQKLPLGFYIDTLPILRHMRAVNERVNFKLLLGLSAETSGGLLVCMSEEMAKQFCEELRAKEGPAWIIGKVVLRPESNTQNTATLSDSLNIIEVDL